MCIYTASGDALTVLEEQLTILIEFFYFRARSLGTKQHQPVEEQGWATFASSAYSASVVGACIKFKTRGKIPLQEEWVLQIESIADPITGL